MSLKKYSYLLVFILMLVIGINGVYAKANEKVYNENHVLSTSVKDINISDVMLFAATEEECEAIFGSADDEKSIRSLINDILEYPKYIVPVIVIGLGIVDLAKAVISSKEDEMRKAQATFVKRVLIGIVIFFVPMIVDFLMNIADMVWETTSCRL